MTVDQRTALEAVISIDKEVMHGTPCFKSTRVPVQTLKREKALMRSLRLTPMFHARPSWRFWI
jgi:hypothetical protein